MILPLHIPGRCEQDGKENRFANQKGYISRTQVDSKR